jgi:hypothetical protein
MEGVIAISYTFTPWGSRPLKKEIFCASTGAVVKRATAETLNAKFLNLGIRT